MNPYSVFFRRHGSHAVFVAAMAVTTVSPGLGDTASGTPITLIGAGLGTVTSITIGGTACTGIEVVNSSLVRAVAPAKAAGTYDVVSTGAAGVVTKTASYEAWHPNQIASGVARVYDSTVGVSTTGNLVDSWADQGAGGQNLTGVLAKRPRYVAGRFGNNLRNSVTWVAADGAAVGDSLTLAAPIAIPTAYSRFWVAKNCIGPYGAAGSGTVVSNATANVAGMASQYVTGQLDTNDLDAGTHHYRGSEFHDGAPYVHGLTHNGVSGDLKYFSNGVQLGATQTDTFGNTRVGWAGLGNSAALTDPFNGEMACAVTVEAEMTAGEVTKLSQWMFGKFIARSYAFHRVATSTAWTARDGAALVTLGTDLYLLGGWNSQAGFRFNADTSSVTNEVWKSTDTGVTWTQILAGDYTYHATINGKTASGARWTPRHMHGAGVIGSTMYIVGSDPFNDPGPPPAYSGALGKGTSDVWSSTDGASWTCVTSTAPWGPRVNHIFGILGANMYVMGGQTDLNNDSTALRDVWKSTDGGANWTKLADAPWAHRGIVNMGLPTLSGKLWLVGGGVYGVGGVPPVGALQYNNDVWSFDGTTWASVSADGVAPFSKRRYNSVVAFDGKLWVINGFGPLASPTNIGDCWSSPDGVTWTEQTIIPWRTSHADGMVALSDRIIMGPGNGCVGQPSAAGAGKVFSITRYGVIP